MKLFTLALLLLAARAAAAATTEDNNNGALLFTPRSVAFGQLHPSVVAEMRAVLAREGILAVADVPGLRQAREDALVSAAKCVLEHGKRAAPASVQLQDESSRSSWAAFAKPRERDAVPPTAECAGLDAKMERLRDAVDQGAEYFARLLDASVVAPTAKREGLLPKADGGVYADFEHLLGNGKHLDHFHVYEKADVHSHRDALDLHTDHGLFISIVPSVRVQAGTLAVSKEEDSFEIETREGERAVVKLPHSGDVLLFMLGDGSNYLKRSALSVPDLRAVPHALSLPRTAERSVRAWFGRMFFAPEDALLTKEGDTFAKAVETVIMARKLGEAFPSLGCASTSGPRRELHDPTGHNCSTGTAYCWMTCMPMGNLSCSNHDVLCVDRYSGEPWVECAGCHNMNAVLRCPGELNLDTRSPTLSPSERSTPPPTNFTTFSPTSAGATAQASLVVLVMSWIIAMLLA